jgi:hypothetical protein
VGDVRVAPAARDTVPLMARRPSWRLAAVVLVALVGLSALAAVVRDDPDEPGEDPPTGSEAFLDAWARSRAVTFRSVSTFTRVSNSTGAELIDRVVVAQRPPDRLTIDRDGALGLVDGRRVACVFRRQRLACEDAPAGRTLEEETARQLETLAEYTTGDDPLYAVTALDPDPDLGDCFELRLNLPDLVAPPLGTVSRYCFDPEIGAPTLTVVERVEADDETRIVRLAGEVTDADLDPDTALRDP